MTVHHLLEADIYKFRHHMKYYSSEEYREYIRHHYDEDDGEFRNSIIHVILPVTKFRYNLTRQ